MVASFVGSVIAHHATDNGVRTPDFSGIAWTAGDLAIATCWKAVNNGFWTSPTDWFPLGSLSNSSTSARTAQTYYKILQTGDDETPDFTPLGSTSSVPNSVVVSIWTGVLESNPIDTFSFPLAAFLNDATPTPDPITTLTDDALAVLFHGSYFATSWTAGAPSGYALPVDYSGSTYDDRQQFLASKTIATAGTETPGDWTHTADPGTSEDGAKQSLALREPQTGDYPQVYEVALSSLALSTSHAISFPTTVVAGDLLLLVVYLKATSDPTITTEPSGFTRLDPGGGGGSTEGIPWIGWKEAVGGEGGGTVAIATDINTTCSAQMFRIRGWDTTNPPEYEETAGFSSDLPSITPSWGADTNLYVGIMANLGQDPLAPPPLNWRLLVEAGSTSSTISQVTTARAESDAGTMDLGDWLTLTTAGTVGGLAAMVVVQGDVVPPDEPDGPVTAGISTGWGIPIS